MSSSSSILSSIRSLSLIQFFIMAMVTTRTASFVQAFRSSSTIVAGYTGTKMASASQRSARRCSTLGSYATIGSSTTLLPIDKKPYHQRHHTQSDASPIPRSLALSKSNTICSIRQSTSFSNVRLFSSNDDDYYEEYTKSVLKPGMQILVEVISFGPLGATVYVVAEGHSADALPPEDAEWPVLAEGLINQQELAYYRDARDNVEVVLGEILPAYVERLRDVDDKLGIALRAFGGRRKATDLGGQIMEVLEASADGTFGLGDKSSPSEIAAEFPGTSKSTFKKAVSALFKKGVIERPGATEIQLKQKY